MSLKSIQRKREYTKYVVDKRLCYYEPSRDKLQKTFAQELSSSLDQKQKSIPQNFSMIKKAPNFLKRYVNYQNTI